VKPARSIFCLKIRHEGISRLFSQADNQIAVFQTSNLNIPYIRKNAAKRYIFVAPKKNAKTHLFGQKRQEVPCFFKEVRFEKRAPLVISREFVNPFAKTGGKASILARLANSRLSAPFAACFLGTCAQETGSEVWMGAAVLANWRPDRRAFAGLGDLSMGGKRRGAEGAESALPGSCVRVPGLVAGAGFWQEWRARSISKNGSSLLYAACAYIQNARKRVAERNRMAVTKKM
jgi:hypothetical protein